jgi:hypothetical protein
MALAIKLLQTLTTPLAQAQSKIAELMASSSPTTPAPAILWVATQIQTQIQIQTQTQTPIQAKIALAKITTMFQAALVTPARLSPASQAKYLATP